MTTRFDGFAAPEVRGNPKARQEWAVEQLKLAREGVARTSASRRHVTFSGALAWPYLYPWPQRPAGLVETAFDELARRWKPILDAFDEAGVDVCYEIHPGEDLHRRRHLRDVPRARRQPSALPASSTIRPTSCCSSSTTSTSSTSTTSGSSAFHVKDAEFNPTGRQGVYGGFQPWVNRAGRFRSLGDGQVDFGGIFSKLAAVRLRRLGGAGMGVRLKHPEDGAREGAPFIASHIIRVTEKAFDDFAGRRHRRGGQPAHARHLDG